MPQFAALSHAECSAIHILREMANDSARKSVKRELFAKAKTNFGIPVAHKLVVETDIMNPNAGILRNKQTRETYELNESGRWIHAAANGAVIGQRWFCLPARLVQQAVIDALDNEEASDETITASDTQPRASAVILPGSDDTVVVDAAGNMWVQLDADAYEQQSSTSEAEDDTPY